MHPENHILVYNDGYYLFFFYKYFTYCYPILSNVIPLCENHYVKAYLSTSPAALFLTLMLRLLAILWSVLWREKKIYVISYEGL